MTKRTTSRRKHLKRVGAGLAGITALAGCSGTGENGSNGGGGGTSGNATNNDNGENVITLGGSLPLTGESASTGQNYEIGYQAAASAINEMGGVPVGDTNYQIELSIEDDASEPERVQSIIQRQINNEGIDFFLGSFGSAIVLPQTSIANRNEKMMVQGGGGGDDIFTQGWEWLVGLFPRASNQNLNGGNYYRLYLEENTEGTPETASIIFENDPFSQSKKDGWVGQFEKESGPEILGQHQIPRNTTSFSSVLSRVTSEDPDVLILTTHADNSQQILQAIATREANFGAIDIGLGPHQPGFQNALGEQMDYINTSTYWTSDLPYGGEVFGEATEFEQYCRDNFQDIPENSFDYHIATGAACLVVYYHGFKQAGTLELEPVRDEIRNLSLTGDESFYGPIEFTDDGDGDPEKLGPNWQQVLDMEVETVYPEEAQTAKPVFPIPPWSER